MNNEQEVFNEARQLIQKVFKQVLPNVDEQDFEQALADLIFEYINDGLEKLFQLLYRLDINESKVHSILSGNSKIPVNVALARLIIDRQKEKAITRLMYRQDIDEEDETSLW